LQLSRERNRLGAGARLAEDFDVGLRGKDHPEAGADQPLVVGEQHPHGHASHIDGTWTVDFATGTYTVTWNGETVLQSDYTVRGSDMCLTEKSGKVKCPGTGEYRFTEKGTSLTFKKISDSASCAGRTAVLTAQPLTRVV
jgi:hypothetical protein